MTQMSLNPADNLEALVNDVLMGKAGPWPLARDQHEILGLLRRCLGRENTLTISSIATKTMLTDREIKSAVKSLVEDFGVPIGASRQMPYGYFLIVSSEDLEFALRPLASEVISIARRMRKLGGSAIVQEMLGQLRVEMDQ